MVQTGTIVFLFLSLCINKTVISVARIFITPLLSFTGLHRHAGTIFQLSEPTRPEEKLNFGLRTEEHYGETVLGHVVWSECLEESCPLIPRSREEACSNRPRSGGDLITSDSH